MSISGKKLNLSPEPDLDELIQDTSLLIASVYNMFDQPRRSPRVQNSLGRRSHNNSDSSDQLGCSTTSNNSSPESPKSFRLSISNAGSQTTPSTREIEREINRIDHFCDMLEHNLRSDSAEQNQMVQDRLGFASPTTSRGRTVGSSPNNASANIANSNTIEEVIDLCDSMYIPEPITRRSLNLSDDVIIVTPNDNDIIDLSTPTNQRSNARSRMNNYSRRSTNSNGIRNSGRNANVPRQRLISTRRSLSSVSSNASSTLPKYFNPSIGSAVNQAKKVSSNKKSPGANCDNSNAGSDGSSDDGRVPFMCAVCMDSCINNQPTSTKCGHVFCSNCIRQAVRLTRKCPMCNTKLTLNMLFRIYI